MYGCMVFAVRTGNDGKTQKKKIQVSLIFGTFDKRRGGGEETTEPRREKKGLAREDKEGLTQRKSRGDETARAKQIKPRGEQTDQEGWSLGARTRTETGIDTE